MGKKMTSEEIRIAGESILAIEREKRKNTNYQASSELTAAANTSIESSTKEEGTLISSCCVGGDSTSLSNAAA